MGDIYMYMDIVYKSTRYMMYLVGFALARRALGVGAAASVELQRALELGAGRPSLRLASAPHARQLHVLHHAGNLWGSSSRAEFSRIDTMFTTMLIPSKSSGL
eukprot:scaffold973_cov399-Prasinococcus_capsulatus_cf.AAC.21